MNKTEAMNLADIVYGILSAKFFLKGRPIDRATCSSWKQYREARDSRMGPGRDAVPALIIAHKDDARWCVQVFIGDGEVFCSAGGGYSGDKLSDPDCVALIQKLVLL
jgi:hypothetical protein